MQVRQHDIRDVPRRDAELGKAFAEQSVSHFRRADHLQCLLERGAFEAPVAVVRDERWIRVRQSCEWLWPESRHVPWSCPGVQEDHAVAGAHHKRADVHDPATVIAELHAVCGENRIVAAGQALRRGQQELTVVDGQDLQISKFHGWRVLTWP
jgi:hypothetical protein